VEGPLQQILVVVANIQMGTLKTEVEKGSMGTAIDHGLADPKEQGNSVQKARNVFFPFLFILHGVGREGEGASQYLVF